MSKKKGFVIRAEVKQQILDRLKNEGIPVAQLASEHGIHPSTLYNGLADNLLVQTPWNSQSFAEKTTCSKKSLDF
jgi:hypothetical protein